MSDSRIYRRGYGPPDFVAYHRNMLRQCEAILDRSEPPKALGLPRPKDLGETLGFPSGTDPRLVRLYLVYLSRGAPFGEIGTELRDQRDERDRKEWTESRRRQLLRYKRDRAKGQPSPFQVVDFVAAYQKREGNWHGGAAAAARYFKKSPSLISKLLKVADEWREVLETARLYFLARLESGGGDENELRELPSIVARTN